MARPKLVSNQGKKLQGSSGSKLQASMTSGYDLQDTISPNKVRERVRGMKKKLPVPRLTKVKKVTMPLTKRAEAAPSTQAASVPEVSISAKTYADRKNTLPREGAFRYRFQ